MTQQLRSKSLQVLRDNIKNIIDRDELTFSTIICNEKKVLFKLKSKLIEIYSLLSTLTEYDYRNMLRYTVYIMQLHNWTVLNNKHIYLHSVENTIHINTNW